MEVGDWKQRYWDELSLTNLDKRIQTLGGSSHYGLFYSALDSIQDMDGALHEFSQISRKPTQLECLGFMQALVTLQDAVMELSNVMKLNWRPSNTPELQEIRDIRNRVVGHPVIAKHGDNSTSFFTHGNITSEGFMAVVQYKGEWRNVSINFEAACAKTDQILTKRMQEMWPELLKLKLKME